MKYGGIKPKLPKYDKIGGKFNGIIAKWCEINKYALSPA